ncbi:MAG: starch synthase [Myxococcota bacterium]|jgi:starch synthase
MHIVLASSEIAPFSKSGGLGDVTGALGAPLVARGHRVLTVSPGYRSVDRARWGFGEVSDAVRIHLGDGPHDVRFSHTQRDGVHHLLVEHPMYDRDGLYGDSHGAFRDNHLRYALLSRAAIEAARRVPVGGSPLGQDVLFHCNDWQTGLLPVYLDALYRPLGLFPRAATVLTMHNPAHQGRLPGSLFADLDLSPRWFGPSGVEWYGDLGLLKGGLVHADELTTVSPTFARDVTTPDGGFGLDGLLRLRKSRLTGILNGIDPVEWDPEADPHLDAAFSAEDLAGKAVCKRALQRELGLPDDPDAAIVGSVGRLDPQKGIELLIESIPWLVAQGAQVVVLGSAAAAHRHYEDQLRALERRFPHRVRAWVGFSERVAHRVEAGSDLFAMPSLFEPCGLNQMYSQRYGTLPVVRRTGGLADSVKPFDRTGDAGTGFLFDAPTGHALRGALWQGLDLFRTDRAAFDRARKRAMRVDWSWARAIPKYESVYRRAAERRGLLDAG